MAIATKREALDNGSPDGSRVRGVARLVIDGGGTARTLLVGESGSLCLLGTAAGQAYTLPVIGANDLGMEFEFFAHITGTGICLKLETGPLTKKDARKVAMDFAITAGNFHINCIAQIGATVTLPSPKTKDEVTHILKTVTESIRYGNTL